MNASTGILIHQNLYLLVNYTFKQPLSRNIHTFTDVFTAVRMLILPDVVLKMIFP